MDSIKIDNYIIEKVDLGYWTVRNKPSEEELSEYYADKYFQDVKKKDDRARTQEEIDYLFNKIKEIEFVSNAHQSNDAKKSMLDVGCGEGWSLNYFHKAGWDVKGLDFSIFGLKNFNDHLTDYFVEGNIYHNLDKIIEKGEKHDLILLNHVLEHVIDPVNLLEKLKQTLSENGLLVVQVPNDFSIIQKFAEEKGMIDRKFWIALPDHLSYFNTETLQNLTNSLGYKTVRMVSDFPIDLNLLNPLTNYIKDKSVGKACFESKVTFENFLHSNYETAQVVSFYEKFAEMGLGRSIRGFFSH